MSSGAARATHSTFIGWIFHSRRTFLGIYCLVFLLSKPGIGPVAGAFAVVRSESGGGNPESQKGDSHSEKDPMPPSTCANPEPHRRVNPQNRSGPGSDLVWFQYDVTDSTQNRAAALVEDVASPPLPDVFAVTAADQTSGRGTSNRIWQSKRGNALFTVGMRSAAWPRRIPLTLLPLQVGVLAAKEIASQLGPRDGEKSGNVTLKWPNDVLVDRRKIAGVLIESAKRHDKEAGTYDYFTLIGIGVNVGHAPSVATTGPNYGRASTCLRDYWDAQTTDENTVDQEDSIERYEAIAQDIGLNIAYRWSSWLSQDDVSAESVVSEWERWVDWDMELQLRNEQRETVRPLGVHPDGRLRVRDDRGTDRLLVSDYFV